MKIEPGMIAVLTGGGSGIGRALSRQLTAGGVHLAICDVQEAGLAETRELCLAGAPAGTRVSTFRADVSNEADLQAFRDAVGKEHATDRIHLLFNNAGIGGGGSFVAGGRAEWERTFGICWGGVYLGCRTFLPMLQAADRGHIVNVSSVNGFWATLGPQVSHTAYSAAKFAVKGFTEALINDLRLHAPHLTCSVVMPGHIGTAIVKNTGRVLGVGDAQSMSADTLAKVRDRMVRGGAPVAGASDEALRELLRRQAQSFQDDAPTTADQAAAIILDGVRAGRWRILVGHDAQRLDEMVRANPEGAYEADFADIWRFGSQGAPGTAPDRGSNPGPGQGSSGQG